MPEGMKRLRIGQLILAASLALAGCSLSDQSSTETRATGSGSTNTAISNPTVGQHPISGASQAVCTPSPCLASAGSTTHNLVNVSNDDGTASPRSYGIYRPQNLLPSRSNRAPAILVFYAAGGCGFRPPGRFVSLAAPNRFIVVSMEVPCDRGGSWEKRNVSSPSTTVPNDEPYVTAVIRDITQCPSSNAGPNQCVDPRRIYAAGMSSGGSMVADILCDAQNSALVRGYLIDSSSLQLFNGAPNCPSSNRNFFAMLSLSNYAADSKLFYDTAPHPHLDVRAFANWAAARLGCTGPRIADAVGYPMASTLRYRVLGPCKYIRSGSTAVLALGVRNGGHGWGCQDSDPGASPGACPGMSTPPGLGPDGKPITNGLFVEGTFWSFVASGVSP